MSDTKETSSLKIRDSLEEKGPAGLVSALASFLVHASVAMVIGPLVVFVAILSAGFIFKHSRGMDSVLGAGGVANPMLWGPGLILGLLVNRFALKSTACWVWLAGLGWIAYGMFASLHAYHARFLGICSPIDNIRSGFFSLVSNYCGTARTSCVSRYRRSAQLPIRSELG